MGRADCFRADLWNWPHGTSDALAEGVYIQPPNRGDASSAFGFVNTRLSPPAPSWACGPGYGPGFEPERGPRRGRDVD